MKRTIVRVSAVLALSLAAAGSLEAIPAFSRKYSLTCKTCHAPFPSLKKYGREFAAQGYAIPDKEAPRSVIDTGDATLTLLREVPLSLRLDGFVTFNNSNTKRVDLAAPSAVKLLSGGEIAKGFSYYLDFKMSDGGRVVGLEDAIVTAADIFGTGLSLSLGQFQVTRPIFNRELRLTLEDYRIYTVTPGLSRIDLTFDRGFLLNYRLATGTDLTLEVLNGMGREPAGDKGNYDFDKFKNFMARVSQDLGNLMRVGGFAYIGWEKQYNVRNDIWMLGADLSLNSAPFYLNAQYVERRDNNPYFRYEVVPDDVPSLATRGAFAELLFLPKGDNSKWYATALFNWVGSDEELQAYLSLTAHFGYLLSRNLRLTLEGTYYLDSPYGGHPRLALGLITSI